MSCISCKNTKFSKNFKQRNNVKGGNTLLICFYHKGFAKLQKKTKKTVNNVFKTMAIVKRSPTSPSNKLK